MVKDGPDTVLGPDPTPTQNGLLSCGTRTDINSDYWFSLNGANAFINDFCLTLVGRSHLKFAPGTTTGLFSYNETAIDNKNTTMSGTVQWDSHGDYACPQYDYASTKGMDTCRNNLKVALNSCG